jgi:hypothetical protein
LFTRVSDGLVYRLVYLVYNAFEIPAVAG